MPGVPRPLSAPQCHHARHEPSRAGPRVDQTPWGGHRAQPQEKSQGLRGAGEEAQDSRGRGQQDPATPPATQKRGCGYGDCFTRGCECAQVRGPSGERSTLAAVHPLQPSPTHVSFD